MKALVITGPFRAEVHEVANPRPVGGEVVVDVLRAGICGTDMEFFTGEMAYLHDGLAAYPIRIGHEWMGVVSAVGRDVDPSWLGRRVTGDTMLGCGVCRRCRSNYQHVCEFRHELGIRGNRAGALAEQVAVPERSLLLLPESVDDTMGALVEPGGNAFRSVHGAALQPGDRALVIGAGTIGLLCALFARADGVEVHVLGRSGRSREFARTLGFDGVWENDDLPELPWDAVIDASNDPAQPERAVHLVEAGKRVVFVGLAGSPSTLDARSLTLADVTAVGVLSASGGLEGTIAAYASGVVDPRPLVAASVSLEDLPAMLAGERPRGSGAGPKFHVTITESR